MSAQDYDLFAAIVAGGSLSEAGRRLSLSPAMVSKRLARLEDRLGTRLIHRTTRRLTLTPAGADFHGEVVALLAAIAAAEARITGRADVATGSLRLSAPTSFGRLHIAPHLPAFVAAHPAIRLSLDLSDGYADLPGQGIDMAVRIAARIPASLGSVRLGTNHRLLCAAPVYIANHGAPEDIAALRRHALLAAEGQFPWRLEGPSGTIEVGGTSLIATTSSEAVREFALAGAGIALRSLWDVERELASGALVRVLPTYRGSADVGIFAVYPAAPIVPAGIRAMIRHLESRLAPALSALERPRAAPERPATSRIVETPSPA